MAKDDYHVIVYQILSYLYQRLKRGEPVDGKQISNESDFFQINEKYWKYIIINMYREGFISGIQIHQVKSLGCSDSVILRLDDCEITPKGIEYLTDNSLMEKAKGFFKEAKEMIPFI